MIFFFKQKTAYEMRISDWSSDVCSSDLFAEGQQGVLDHKRRIVGRAEQRATEVRNAPAIAPEHGQLLCLRPCGVKMLPHGLGPLRRMNDEAPHGFGPERRPRGHNASRQVCAEGRCPTGVARSEWHTSE